MNDFQKKVKESFLKEHPCPPWSTPEHWNKALNKVTFTPKGEGLEISYKGMSIEEIELLQGLVPASVANGFFTPQTRKLRQPIVEKHQLEQKLKHTKVELAKHRGKKIQESTKKLLELKKAFPNLRTTNIATKAKKLYPEYFEKMDHQTLMEKISRLK